MLQYRSHGGGEMTVESRKPNGRSRKRSFNQELLSILPGQGEWSVESYLWLTNSTNRLIEFTNGRLEVLPMLTSKHQSISEYMYALLLVIMQRIGGKIHYLPLRLQIAPSKFREPDLLLLLNKKDIRNQNAFWTGADLVVEIVSPDDPDRDLVVKREDYAQAGIPEYWIVNPIKATITVLMLADDQYAEHGVFRRGEIATSKLLSDFQVNVSECLDAE
jgi:Uma2 family endonuclease